METSASSNYGSNTYSVEFRGCDKTLRSFLNGINEYYAYDDGSSDCNGSTVNLYGSSDDFRKDWMHPQVSIDIPWRGFVDISQVPQEQLGRDVEPLEMVGFWGSDHWYAYFV